tara:strand:- start:5422 stop:5823 length:402 start_codon:yes stop_codon:yes gene_type:complete
MKNRHNLTIDQENKDLTILGDSLKAKGFKFKNKSKWINSTPETKGHFLETENPEIRSSAHSTKTQVLEGNYIRISNVNHWSETNHKNLLEALKLANTMTSDYNFEYGDITDYEVEWDGDRDWPASFTFYSHKK